MVPFTKVTFNALGCLLALGLIANGQPVTREYTVVNNCPASIDLYIAGTYDTTLASGASTTTIGGPDTGFFYTSVNGGNANGAATRAGFFGAGVGAYYYIVVDTAQFNTGISITPNNYSPSGGFCGVAECNDVSCTNAFPQPPTGFPPVSSTPPNPPVYSCQHPDVAFTITFCPSGSFPTPPAPVALHPNGNTAKCMDVRGAVYANGTPVQIYDCNGTGAQKWVLNRGATKVKVFGQNFCLDAGSTPANGVGMKIWQCFDDLPAQQWFYGPDGVNSLSLDGTAFCLDLTNGVLTNSNQLQTWQCFSGNTNQVWTE